MCDRKAKYAWLVALALILCVGVGCDGTSVTGSQESGSQLDDTPRGNGEAEDAALWLSGELVAPEDLYKELRAGYKAIRARFAHEIPSLDRVTFVAPWVSGRLLVKLSDEDQERLRRGEYTDLDDLNSTYCVAKVDTSLLRLRWVQLIFEGRLHPDRLAEIYREVESLESVSPNGKWNNRYGNYPWIVENTLTFLFREGWGDCPAGCFGHRFWYFRVKGGHVEYVGTYTTEEPKPDWWDEASSAYLAMTGEALDSRAW